MSNFSYRFRNRFSNFGAIATIIFGLAFVGLIVAAFAGWVMNIIAICHLTAFSGLAAMRVIGVFIAPIGAVLGWF